MIPQILQLDAAGFPQKWIKFKKYAEYSSKGLILWSFSPSGTVLRGGTNRFTGKQSTLELDTIVAIDGPVRDPSLKRVPLKNEYLFRRDQKMCAYCGKIGGILTRDHVHPTSRGGPNVWENVVTSCYSCNSQKDDRTPEEARMELLYVPYAPVYDEYLILRNHNILADQMDFLLKRVPKERHERYL